MNKPQWCFGKEPARSRFIRSRFRATIKASEGSLLDQAAVFEAAVLLHLNAAYTLARYLTRRGDTAEDIVQEALLRAYRSFESQRGDNVRAWLRAKHPPLEMHSGLGELWLALKVRAIVL